MLSPEVWTFLPPRSTYKERFGGIAERNFAVKAIQNFHFNHLVSVVLPDTVNVPKDLINSLAVDSEYYKIENISISEFVKTNFIENFIKNGRVTLLSIDTQIDIDDCVCLTPTGVLILSLKKNTFETLGLEGNLSHFSNKNQERYIVQLDLKNELFTKSTKLQQRAVQNLQNHLPKFTVILSWEGKTKICPSSIAKYFYDKKFDVKLCSPKIRVRTEYQVDVPVFCEDSSQSCETKELVEWLGMFSLKADCARGCALSYANTYEVPEPKVKYGQVQYFECRGFFTSKKIQQFFECLRNYISINESIPWISLYVQGFSDTPVAWGLQEHHYFTNGDNGYLTFLMPSGKYMLCTQKCSNKRHK